MLDRLISRRRLFFLVVVAGLHLLLMWLLLGSLHRSPADPQRKATYLVKIQLAPLQPVPQVRAVRRPISRPVAPPTNASTPPTADAEALVSTGAIVLDHTAAAAASAPLAPTGLDPHATDRALREAARNPTLAHRARERDGKTPATLDQRLEAGVKSAGRRDCLNASVNPGAQGDSTLKYSPIPVSGLLVAPFIVADSLLGKCGL